MVVSFDFDKIKTPKELLEFLENNLKYGFVAEDGTIFTKNFKGNFEKYYKLRLGDDLIKTGLGVCWDAVEFERLFFEKKNIEHECYYIQAFKSRQDGGPTHTFVLFKTGTEWCWFEYTWPNYKGIHTYKSKTAALNDICNKHLENAKQDHTDIRLYKYANVTKGLNAYDFIDHCYAGEKIPLKIDLKNFKVIV